MTLDHFLSNSCFRSNACFAAIPPQICRYVWHAMHGLPWLTHSVCPVCAMPTLNAEVCGDCLKHSPMFDATHALLEYRFPVDKLLRRYKYSGFLVVANLMATLISRRLAQHALPDLLIPMPLSACSRIKPTSAQAGFSLEDRRKNLRGVFMCDMDLSGKTVALLDDVMTTGASLDELARAVRKAGATRVECWVAARTLKH